MSSEAAIPIVRVVVVQVAVVVKIEHIVAV